MNGAQDLGGMMGFGPIGIEVNEPVFHAPWEARALAVTLAVGFLGRWSIDVPPADVFYPVLTTGGITRCSLSSPLRPLYRRSPVC